MNSLSRPRSVGSNPSLWRRRIPIVLIALVDFVIATYLALYQWEILESVWDPLFGTQSEAVLESALSKTFQDWFHFPDAALGAAAYLAEAVLGLIGSTRRWRTVPWLVVLFGLNAAAVTLVGLILIVVQAAVVDAWCLLCLVTAILSAAMLLMTGPEVRLAVSAIGHSWKTHTAAEHP
ncbi:MAG: vitamin K epoxide reductase family protein [Planctomycetota bacterium]